MNRIQKFFQKKDVEISAKRYFIDAMSAMAMGLFSSLLVGTILNTIGIKLHIAFLTDTVWPICRDMTGAAIGVAVAYSLKAHTFVFFSAAIAGYAGNKFGGAVGAFISVIIGTELGKLVSRETKIDLIVTPMVTILSGSLVAVFFGPYMSSFMNWLGQVIMTATNLRPFWMGMSLAVLVGVILTLPISSAALCMMLSLSGLAGGAAAAGCCAQMIGFAVMSYRDNGFGGCVAVGIGTSMLHMSNIMKNPRIWIPPTAAAAVLGPISTVLLKLENTPIGSGMGTCGFVGQIGALTAMDQAGRSSASVYLSILLLHFVAPAVLTFLFTVPLRKIGWIKDGDLKLAL
ncbi:MAG: PTS transporter subunit IIC [Treponema sp.]|uniref:PTS transporter subunit IIC n=1 Tax=Treponema sp. TaxID=166 RepID=UPI003FA29D85